jgi:excinuclease ABC subunit A
MASGDVIRIRGARQHNLKGVDVDVPLGRLTVVTGVSGSGKSSLAFDTLYAEGQRRYVETFSAYARQFLDRMDRPDVDAVTGIPPAVAIERSGAARGSRSTVGTLTELNDHLKVLWARVGRLRCPGCGEDVADEGPEAAADALRALPEGTRLVVGFPVRVNGDRAGVARDLATAGFTRVLAGGEVREVGPEGAALSDDPAFVVVDRVVSGRTARSRLVDSFETAFRGGAGRAGAEVLGGGARRLLFSRGLHCPRCERTFRPPHPNLFSSNSPVGACPTCHGFGRTSGIDWDLVVPDPVLSLDEGAVKPLEMPSARTVRRAMLAFARAQDIPTDVSWVDLPAKDRRRILEGEGAWEGVAGWFERLRQKIYKVHVRVLLSRYRGYPTCPDCDGERLAPEGRAWRVGGRSLPAVLAMDVARARAFFDALEVPGALGEAAGLLLREVRTRLDCLDSVGLGYLALDRQARTLSGGELQRVNLTAAIGTNLVGTLFVLDEPSVGLHPRDNARLVSMLRRLTDQGNTVVVVEHDPAILAEADHVIDLGPGAGERGGQVVAAGPPEALARAEGSITGAWLAGRRRVKLPTVRRTKARKHVGVLGARANNLKGVDLLVGLGELTVLSGVSGSGKSSLAEDVLCLALLRRLGRPEGTPGPHDRVVGAEHVRDVVRVDPAAAGRSTRANPATYTGAWDAVRALYGRTPGARAAGFTASTFSFNVAGGRCERCEGEGVERVEMQFLSDVEVPCPDCLGARFRPEVRDVEWEGISVAAALRLTVDEALHAFRADRRIVGPLAPLAEVGLGYLRLGQPLSTFSSGEAQRLRLARALGEHELGPCLYVFDEPTTGLHLEDVAVLLNSLRRLADRGHAVLVVEHHLDVLASADRLVDLGPEGGEAGGRIVADGTPAEVARSGSATARFLAPHLEAGGRAVPLGRRSTPRPPPPKDVRIRGAHEHNLKGVDVDLPLDAFVVVSGPSGSGKSTLAFDIVFAEGQRRYIDTLSAYARQFVGQLRRPAVDHVEGIPPTVAIEQRRSRGGRRSTVATVTEVAHFLRLLFARAGVPHCPSCDQPIETLPASAIEDRVVAEHADEAVAVLAPVLLGRKGIHKELLTGLRRRGHQRVLVDGVLLPLDPLPSLDRWREHDVLVEVGTLDVRKAGREGVRALVARALLVGEGSLALLRQDGTTRSLSLSRTCPRDGATVPELDPRFFSHNSHRGWCPACRGIGQRPRVDAALLPVKEDVSLQRGAVPALTVEASLHKRFVREAQRELGVDPKARWGTLPVATQKKLLHGGPGAKGRFAGAAERLEAWLSGVTDVAVDWFGQYATHQPCDVCGGERLRPEARAVRVGGRTLPSLLGLPIHRFVQALEALPLGTRDAAIAAPIVREARERVGFLESLGLGYLTLDRDATTLSGGETQRIRLGAQLGSNLRGVCYVLDEPTIGLHPRDNARLLDALEALRDRGNTLLVVEHDLDTIRRADRVVDLGPGGGRNGGRIVAEGTPEALAEDPNAPTGRALARPPPALRASPRAPSAGDLVVEGARLHNLQDLDVRIPLGRLVAVTGVSGSGKSTLVRDVVYEEVLARLSGGKGDRGRCRRLSGLEPLARALEVDATPVGQTPRSVPATYLGIWDEIRKALALTHEARARGYGPSRFSFNVKEGRCPDCQGRGTITVEMSFLPDVDVPCERCEGRRFTDETLEVTWKGLDASQLLALTFAEANDLFRDFPKVAPFVALMNDVGLDYLTLGQPSTTLSGGEAQRLKLVTELGRPAREGSTLYVLDEPTTGLHAEDVDRLIAVLRRLVDRGDTVLVIEHHLGLIAGADHVIDLGPEGGEAGGRVVAQGSPKDVARAWRRSHTGQALRALAGAPARSPT